MPVGGSVSLLDVADETRRDEMRVFANECPGSAFSCEDNSGTTAS
jgi:hypothetical protein